MSFIFTPSTILGLVDAVSRMGRSDTVKEISPMSTESSVAVTGQESTDPAVNLSDVVTEAAVKVAVEASSAVMNTVKQVALNATSAEDASSTLGSNETGVS